MAILYVRSTDGSNADNGSTWALAKATIAGALAAAVAGDTIYVSQVHSESVNTTITFSHSNFNSLNPIRILCANDAAEPPTALATTAVVATTESAPISHSNGFLYWHGITFAVGVGSTFNIQPVICDSPDSNHIFVSCQFQLQTTSTAAAWSLGASSASPITMTADFTDCLFRVAAGAQAWQIREGRYTFRGGAVDAGGSAPLSFLRAQINQGHADVLIDGMDFSPVSTAVINIQSVSGDHHFVLRNSIVPSGTGITTGTLARRGGPRIIADNCGAAAGTQAMYRQATWGTVTDETTIVREGGAEHGATPIAWRMASVANLRFTDPLLSPEIALWIDATGAKTFTVEILHDSVTALTDAEVWLEVEYLGASGDPRASFSSDRVADILATPANQASSPATWTTTGLSNPQAQRLAVTAGIGQVGPVLLRVAMAKPSYTVYVDPKVAVS